MHPTCRAAICALTLTLPLTACGRVGALDPPPGGLKLEAGAVRTPVTRRGVDAPETAAQEQSKRQGDYDENGRPIIPEGVKRKVWLDFLLD